MAAQQGAFLSSLAFGSRFEETLAGMKEEITDDGPPLLKITIPKSERVNILWGLKRMNIDRASLFPGIEGFARSIALEVEVGANAKVQGPPGE